MFHTCRIWDGRTSFWNTTQVSRRQLISTANRCTVDWILLGGTSLMRMVITPSWNRDGWDLMHAVQPTLYSLKKTRWHWTQPAWTCLAGRRRSSSGCLRRLGLGKLRRCWRGSSREAWKGAISSWGSMLHGGLVLFWGARISGVLRRLHLYRPTPDLPLTVWWVHQLGGDPTASHWVYANDARAVDATSTQIDCLKKVRGVDCKPGRPIPCSQY